MSHFPLLENVIHLNFECEGIFHNVGRSWYSLQNHSLEILLNSFLDLVFGDNVGVKIVHVLVTPIGHVDETMQKTLIGHIVVADYRTTSQQFKQIILMSFSILS